MARMFLQGAGGGQPGATGQGAEQTEIQVSTDKRTNSVVVAATKEQIFLLDGLIAEMDKTPQATVAEIRAFRLENADARDLAAILMDLFKQPTTANRNLPPNQQNMPGWVQQFMNQQAGVDANPYAPEPKFTVDQRTNTLLVSAVASEMGVISELVKSLDKDQSLRQSVMVIPLHEGDATNVAKVLSDLLQAQTQIASGQPQGGGQQRVGGAATALNAWSGDLSGQAKVVADPDANAVVVTTLPKNFPRIRAIVQDLDRVRREVLLECLIAEITLDDKGELGVQWSTNWIRDFASQPGGTSNAGVDFGLGALSNGFKYTSASQHVSTVIRALRTEGKLNVLSSPKILALENKPAEISVGQDVPYVTNSRITTNGDTVNTVQYRTVGIILQATPAINEDGGVRMKIHPEVSQIGPDSEAVTITANVKSPVFERNFADTTITVRDGETAIIGGMIRTDVNETTQKIPIIGDLPIVGRIFQNRVHEKKKTEIVVFITPHVIEDAETLRRRTRAASEEFTLAPAEIIQQEIERWTNGLDPDCAVSHYNKGTVYLEGARYDDAVHELEQAVAAAPRDAASRFNLGLALARKGDLERAELTLRAAIDLDPRDSEVHYNLGAVLWRRGEFGAAAGEFKTALQLDSKHEEARKWLQRAEAASGRPAPPGGGAGGGEPPKGDTRVK
jgi:type II secretion system protein D